MKWVRHAILWFVSLVTTITPSEAVFGAQGVPELVPQADQPPALSERLRAFKEIGGNTLPSSLTETARA